MRALPFAVAILAVWRVTHFLVEEDGPFALSLHVRRLARRVGLRRLLDCFPCCSVWVAVPVSWSVAASLGEAALAVAALSGAAILVERATGARAADWVETEGGDGMLRR
ncbi:MAG: hypothetical protein ABW221_06095 [Vicinamibacteria bacterium]